METIWQDVRLGFRMIARNPGFTAVVVLILAVGIGANTAVFSVVNAVILRPLPYRDPHNFVTLWQQTKYGERRPHHQAFLAWRQQHQVFESLAGYGRQRFYVTGIERGREIWAIACHPISFRCWVLRLCWAGDSCRRRNSRGMSGSSF